MPENDAERASLRDRFAAAALSGLAARHGKHDGQYSKEDRRDKSPENEARWLAVAAYRIADAMLAARENPDA